MKGTIRLIVGFILVLGGVGGMELSTEAFPLDSLAWSIAGLGLMAWAVRDVNKTL